jgi:hypothetical protein
MRFTLALAVAAERHRHAARRLHQLPARFNPAVT